MSAELRIFTFFASSSDNAGRDAVYCRDRRSVLRWYHHRIGDDILNANGGARDSLLQLRRDSFPAGPDAAGARRPAQLRQYMPRASSFVEAVIYGENLKVGRE